MRVKSNETLVDCPNTSTRVTTRVWLSVPNLSNSATTGKEQISASPPSNEHVILAIGLLASQKNRWRPGTASAPQITRRSARQGKLVMRETTCITTKVEEMTKNINFIAWCSETEGERDASSLSKLVSGSQNHCVVVCSKSANVHYQRKGAILCLSSVK